MYYDCPSHAFFEVVLGLAPATVEAMFYADQYCGQELACTTFGDKLAPLNGTFTSYRQLNNLSFVAHIWDYSCRSGNQAH